MANASEAIANVQMQNSASTLLHDNASSATASRFLKQGVKKYFVDGKETATSNQLSFKLQIRMFCKPTRVKYTCTESTVANTTVKQLCKTSSIAKKLDIVKLRRENSNTPICKVSKGQTKRLQAHVVSVSLRLAIHSQQSAFCKHCSRKKGRQRQGRWLGSTATVGSWLASSQGVSLLRSSMPFMEGARAAKLKPSSIK